MILLLKSGQYITEILSNYIKMCACYNEKLNITKVKYRTEVTRETENIKEILSEMVIKTPIIYNANDLKSKDIKMKFIKKNNKIFLNTIIPLTKI